MAHHEDQPTAIESVLELLSEHGLVAMAQAMQTLLNEAMKLERSEFLRAAPGERTAYANGFKGKALRTRVGELALRVPQVRALPGGEAPGFYPKSLERGLRSERALKLAIAERYVQGVSTRRVTEVTRERCGLEVTARITSDDHAGLRAGRRAVFPNLPWQRCQFHLQQNAQAYVANVALRPQVARDLRSMFNAAERGEAEERLAKLVEKYRRPAPKLAEWMEANVLEGLAVFALPEPRRHAVPERSLAPPPRLGDGRRDQRRMGDRTDLLEPGERVRTSAQALLQKKGCFISAADRLRCRAGRRREARRRKARGRRRRSCPR